MDDKPKITKARQHANWLITETLTRSFFQAFSRYYKLENKDSNTLNTNLIS